MFIMTTKVIKQHFRRPFYECYEIFILIWLLGFTFNSGCNKPYYEFPIYQDEVYTGGSPGSDRVVIGTVDTDAGTAVFCGVYLC